MFYAWNPLLIIYNNYPQEKYVYNLKLISYSLINLKLVFKISYDHIALGIKEMFLDWIIIIGIISTQLIKTI